MSVRSELELAESSTHGDVGDDASELQEHEFVLDPDEVVEVPAEGQTGTRAVRPLPPPPPPPRRPQLRVADIGYIPAYARSRSPSGVFPIAEVEQALASQASPPAGVTAADAEISRLKAQLRARDAYVVEIERALDEWTGQLAAAGIANAGDLAELVGRARGLSFRASELESELSRTAQDNRELRAALARDGERDESPLRRVRGIGRRYARLLEALGVVSVEQIAAWTAADVTHYAAELRIAPSRITRDGWIDQARALCVRG